VVVVANGMIARWAILALRAMSLNCPQDLSLFALDEPEWAELVTPRLSSVRQPTHEMTQSAWDLLRARMQGESGPPRLVVWNGHISFRESVGRPARRRPVPVRLRRAQ
jgi:LacI family transcriptional regulator